MHSIGMLVRDDLGRYSRIKSLSSIAAVVIDEITGTEHTVELSRLAPAHKIAFKKLVEEVNSPRYVRPGDAAFDVHAAEEKVLKAGSKTVVRTGVALNIPPGHYIRLSSRSGLSAKHSIEVGAGTIDETFTGELQVILYNHSNVDYVCAFNERICQGVLLRYDRADLVEVDNLQENNVRGSNGLGSSGRL